MRSWILRRVGRLSTGTARSVWLQPARERRTTINAEFSGHAACRLDILSAIAAISALIVVTLVRSITTHSESDTAAAGRELSTSLEGGAVVLLWGDLGAGKTAFVRGLAEGLGIDPGEVSSPTFTVIQEYRGGRLALYHVDLYRLQPVEVDDLGLDEITLAGGVTAIEWPDRLPRPFADAISVEIVHGDDSTRTIQIGTLLEP